MTRQELQARMDAATKSCKEQGLIKNDCDKDSFSDYWANSASQSYCNKVKNGQVKVIKI